MAKGLSNGKNHMRRHPAILGPPAAVVAIVVVAVDVVAVLRHPRVYPGTAFPVTSFRLPGSPTPFGVPFVLAAFTGHVPPHVPAPCVLEPAFGAGCLFTGVGPLVPF